MILAKVKRRYRASALRADRTAAGESRMTWSLSQSIAHSAGTSAGLPSRVGIPVLLALLAMLASLFPGTALAQPNRPASAASDSAGGFQRFIQGLWPLAQARGISRATFDAAMQGLTPDPAIIALTKKQSEFVAPILSLIHI
jgi:hypothetical protein